MVYAQHRIRPGEWDAQISLGFWDTNKSPNVGQTTKRKERKNQNCRIVDFAVPADNWIKIKESEKRDKYQDLARGLKNLWNMKVTVILIVIGTLGIILKRIGEVTGTLGNKRTSGDHPDHIIKIGLNTEKSPGDLRRLAVIQSPVRNYLLTLVWKTFKRVK